MQFDSASSIGTSSRGPVSNYPNGTGSAMTLLMILFCIIFYLLIFQSQQAEAWGSDGHEIVGNIAYSRLSEEAKATVNTILMGSQFLMQQKSQSYRTSSRMSPLANVATWADKVRYTKAWHWTEPLHFIDVEDETYEHGCHYNAPPDKKIDADVLELDGMYTCRFVYERDCKNDFCVAGAIANYSTILEELNTNDYEYEIISKEKRLLRGQQEQSSPIRDVDLSKNSTDLLVDSLMFVTHFIGDIHQPLHCSRKSDRGGNSFTVHFEVLSEEKHKWNLHSVWDTGIITKSVHETYDRSRDAFEDEILRLIETEYVDQVDYWLNCKDGRHKVCTSEWGQESLKHALQYSYRTEKGVEVEDNSTLSFEYYESRLPIVQTRLAAAGIRLAATLEMILGNGV